MKRKNARESAFLAEFELSFGHTCVDELLETARENGEYGVDSFAESLLRLVEDHAETVEQLITENLKGWNSDRVSKTSISLLRLSIAEMLYGEPDMDSIIINEAVELSKKYAGDKDYQFVNGVLGTISRQQHPDQGVKIPVFDVADDETPAGTEAKGSEEQADAAKAVPPAKSE